MATISDSTTREISGQSRSLKIISHRLTASRTLVGYSVMKDTGVITSDITFDGRNIIDGGVYVIRGILLWRFQSFADID